MRVHAEDLTTLSAQVAAAAIARGQITSEALVEACLARIEERENDVRAWVHIDSEKALEQARARDGEKARGALHGVPIGVKDIIDTADMPTEYGSAVYRGHRPKWDASCVALLRRAGAIILGKTVTTEFADRHPERTRNPLNLLHTPGGSSSGSAAAVSDRMVPLAVGTQTAGSVIRPASYCGIIGYKPSFGAIHRSGMRPLRETLDTIGFFARTVSDAALLFAALTGTRMPLFEPAGEVTPRVGLCLTPHGCKAEEPVLQAMEAVRSKLNRTRAGPGDITLPRGFDELDRAADTIATFETGQALAYEWQTFRKHLSPTLRGVLESAEELTYDDYRAARDRAASCRSMLRDVFADCDVLVTPSAPGEAPYGLESTGDPVFNKIWSLLYVPCVTIPVLKGPNGLPVSVQIVAPEGCDERALLGADWLQRSLSR